MNGYEIARIFEMIAPLDSGITGDDLGFLFGDPNAEVTGIGCLWCIETKSIMRCVENGLNFIICHESPWIAEQISQWYESVPESSILPNKLRKELLEKHKITVYRSHSNWDALKKYGISDSAVDILGIEGLRQLEVKKFYSVQEMPKEISVNELMHIVQKALGFDVCRIFGDKDKRISRFAFLIGGFGENQLHMPQRAMENGAEAVIIGEMSEFIVLACLDMGLPVIESLHSASEIPGIKNQVKVLKEKLPGLNVIYIPSGAAADR